MKKILAIVLTVIMVLSMTACAPQGGETTDATKPQTQSTQGATNPIETTEAEKPYGGELPLVDPASGTKLTIGIRPNAKIESYDENDLTKFLEEKTGIDIEFVFFPTNAAEAATQLALMISGEEELPDILYNMSGLDLAAVKEYGRDGIFLDLAGYFDEYAYYWNQTLQNVYENDQAMIRALGEDPDTGALYAFPYYSRSLGIDGAPVSVTINQEFLDAVGAELPTNIQQLRDVLYKFKTEDPNGNGEPDEIPLIGYNGMRGCIQQYLLNAFVLCSYDYLFNCTDGELWLPFVTDEYREGLIYLNQMYKDGLISPQTYTTSDGPSMTAIFTPADKVAIAGVVGGHTSVIGEKDNEVLYQYVALPPLSGETDKGGYGFVMGSTFKYTTFITKYCEQPELAFKLLDFMSSQEAYLRARYGVEDRDWKWAKDSVSQFGTPATIDLINTVWGSQNSITWNMDPIGFALYDSIFTNYNDDGSWRSYRLMLGVNVRKGYENAKKPAEMVYDLAYNEAENEVVSEVKTLLTDYFIEARDLFITNVMDPSNDDAWEQYVKACEDQGMSKLLEAAQSAYDRMHAK